MRKESNLFGGFSGLLFLTFLILKLTGVINWSWWWVTCPLWAGVALLIIFFIGLFIIEGIRGWTK